MVPIHSFEVILEYDIQGPNIKVNNVAKCYKRLFPVEWLIFDLEDKMLSVSDGLTDGRTLRIKEAAFLSKIRRDYNYW